MIFVSHAKVDNVKRCDLGNESGYTDSDRMDACTVNVGKYSIYLGKVLQFLNLNLSGILGGHFAYFSSSFGVDVPAVNGR